MSQKKNVRNAILIAGAMIFLTLLVVSADKAGYIGDATGKRVIKVAIGLLVVYFSNLAPKTLEPLSEGRDPARVQALQRFTGWALVLGGLGYALAWLVVPIEHAAIVSMAILGSALLLVVARCLWTIKARPGSQPPLEP